jgi:hypothetical protein
MMALLMAVNISNVVEIVDLWLNFKKYNLAINYRLHFSEDTSELKSYIMQKIYLIV